MVAGCERQPASGHESPRGAVGTLLRVNAGSRRIGLPTFADLRAVHPASARTNALPARGVRIPFGEGRLPGRDRPGHDEKVRPDFPTRPTPPKHSRPLPIVAATFVQIGLADPVTDGLVRALELAGELSNRAPRANQLYHLVAKLRRIRQMCSWHRGFLLPKGFGIHESGSTPVDDETFEAIESRGREL